MGRDEGTEKNVTKKKNLSKSLKNKIIIGKQGTTNLLISVLLANHSRTTIFLSRKLSAFNLTLIMLTVQTSFY